MHVEQALQMLLFFVCQYTCTHRNVVCFLEKAYLQTALNLNFKILFLHSVSPAFFGEQCFPAKTMISLTSCLKEQSRL